jgi:hypothetical protein
VRLLVELLEDRNLLSTTLGLTPLSQVSNLSTLGGFIPPGGTTQIGSEVEPYIDVDPTNSAHAVAVYQQDRYTGSGARAIVASVSYNANAAGGATWSAPTAIPGFDGSLATSAYQRYSDPWVSFAANGDIYASALAVSFVAGFPSTSAILVTKSTDGGFSWAAPTTIIDTPVPPGTNPIDSLNDKESITADPTPGFTSYAYVAWDRLNMPSDQQNFNAFHAFSFRGDAMFARTTDGGATWGDPQVIWAPLANQQSIGHQIAVLPGGTLVDSFTILNGSGGQPARAAQNTLAFLRSTDHGTTWSAPILGPHLQALVATDPDTGADIRTGEILADFTVDPANGNLYVVWADARFSNFKHNDIAFSMSTDGGFTWSAPIKINQTPTNIPEADQQAFTPSVAVNSAGTVAVTYYDFRNNTNAAGVPTDYWLVHADSAFTNPASWTADEKRLTDSSFNLQNAPVSRGSFLGDYQGLEATGTSFYALFAQAGPNNTTNRSNIWFRDPPPAPTDFGAGTSLVSPITQTLGDFLIDFGHLTSNENATWNYWSDQELHLQNEDDAFGVADDDITSDEDEGDSSILDTEAVGGRRSSAGTDGLIAGEIGDPGSPSGE